MPWTPSTLYLMRQPGRARSVFALPKDAVGEPSTAAWMDGFTSACFDGKQFWAVAAGRQPRLVVVDPASGQAETWQVPQDALPPMNLTATIAPLGPGKVFLAGAEKRPGKTPRTWFAVVHHDASGSWHAKVFHHIGDWPNVSDSTGIKGLLRKDYVPGPAVTLYDPDDSARCMVVIEGRLPSGQGYWPIQHPLVIHFDGEAPPRVKEMPFRNRILASYSAVWKNELYFLCSAESADPGFPLYLWRFGFSSDDPVTVRPVPALEDSATFQAHRMAFAGDRLFVIDSNYALWTAENVYQRFHRLGGNHEGKLDFQDRYNQSLPLELIHSKYHGLIGTRPTEDGPMPVHRVGIPADLLQATAPPPTVERAVPIEGVKLYAYPGTWTAEQARTIAQVLGGRLAQIDSPSKLRRLRSMLEGYTTLKWWLAEMPEGEPNVTAAQGLVLYENKHAKPTRGLRRDQHLYEGPGHGFIIQWDEQSLAAADARLARAVPPNQPSFTNKAGVTFVRIPAGTFTMTSDDPDTPPRRVRIEKPFWMSTTEITVEQWRGMCGSTPLPGSTRSTYGPERGLPFFVPREKDMQRFCQRMGELDGHTYRLPTDVEWEYACRAGSTTRFANGDSVEDLKRIGWCSYDGEYGSAGDVRPVASLEPNAWGLYDMHGNLWERVRPTTLHKQVGEGENGEDGPAIYIAKPVKDARATVTGGSWFDPPASCASSGPGPVGHVHSIGLRVVLVDDDQTVQPNNSPAAPQNHPGQKLGPKSEATGKSQTSTGKS